MTTDTQTLISHLGIPYYWTEFDIVSAQAIVDGCGKGQEEVWASFLDNYPITEGIADLETSPILRSLINVQEHERYPFDERLREIDSWIKNFAYDPALDYDPTSLLMLASVSALNSLLKSNLLSIVANGAPSKGHLLYFTSRLHRCLVISYSVLNNNVVDTALVATISKPKTVFDLFDNIDRITPVARNVLKGMLASGHKIIGHRNTLVHVDRRNDFDVFGPSIDTLYLNEMLYKYLYEYERLYQNGVDFSKFKLLPDEYDRFDPMKSPRFTNVLEIGSGNGLLITSLVKNIAWLNHFVAIDPSLHAINCTYRASAQQRTYKGQSIGDLKGSYICGRFNPDFLKMQFDIVLCNPPYIPVPAKFQTRQQPPFMEAISGTELLTQVLQSLPKILTDAGFLFIVCSSLAEPEFKSSIPDDISIEPLGSEDGIEVPFDVEAVLNNQQWLDWLIEQRNLIRRGDVYYHRIRCYALHKSEKAGFTDRLGLLKRMTYLNTKLQDISSKKGELRHASIHFAEPPIITSVDSMALTATTIILRFRDLVTSNNQTINLHQQVIDEQGFVWWGWWKKQTEIAPSSLLRDLSQRVRTQSSAKSPLYIYFYDSGQERLFKARLLQIAFHHGKEIACPDPMAMPAYYRGRDFAAWFKLATIDEEDAIQVLQTLTYHSFPTLTSGPPALVNKRIAGPGELSKTDVTLWLVKLPFKEQVQEEE